jgi:hypothetical protein
MYIRTFGPKQADHPSIGKLCPRCGKPFKCGDFTALIAIEGGFSSKEDEQKALAGHPFNIECEEVHYECAIGTYKKSDNDE